MKPERESAAEALKNYKARPTDRNIETYPEDNPSPPTWVDDAVVSSSISLTIEGKNHVSGARRQPQFGSALKHFFGNAESNED